MRLTDTSEKSLYHLFVQRFTSIYLKSPLADDIVISYSLINGEEVINDENKPSSYNERKRILDLLDGNHPNETAAFNLPLDAEIESARHELVTLNPNEISDPYLRKRVGAYLQICRQIIKKGSPIVATSLKDACGNDNWLKLRQWFVDNYLCDPVTFAWIDNKKGSGKLLISYLRELKVKGYCERDLTASEVRNIAKNDFKKASGMKEGNFYKTLAGSVRGPILPYNT